MAKRERIKVSYEDEETITIREAFNEFITEKQVANLAPVTIRNYKESVERFLRIVEIDFDEKLSSISKDTINNFVLAKREEGIANTTINHYLRDIKAFLVWCMDSEQGYLEPFKIQITKEGDTPVKFFTDEEVEALIEKPVKRDSFAHWREWAITCTILGTGMRTATVINIKMGDLDLKGDNLTYRHTKSGKIQVVPITPSLHEILAEYVMRCRKDCTDDDWLFPNTMNEQLTGNALRHDFVKYCTSRGVQRHNLHGLRHTFARNYVRTGGEGLKLQKMLGHSTLTMTEKYVKLFNDDLRVDLASHTVLDTKKESKKRKKMVFVDTE